MTGTGEPFDDDALQPGARSMLFAVRVWREQVAGGPEYRGSARDVVGGAFCSFRRWANLAAFIAARVDERQTPHAGTRQREGER
jgi:hypothetical protein